MGPGSSNYVVDLITRNTPAKRDQDHIPFTYLSIPQTPDRTRHLKFREEDPTPYILQAARKLELIEADFAIVVCNTAHAFLPRIVPQVGIPFISMIDATWRYIRRHFPHAKNVGLLATTGTVDFNIYGQSSYINGFNLIVPDKEIQEGKVMEAVYGKCGVKAGHTDGLPTRLLLEASQHLIHKGAEVIIAGCTEIPMVLTAAHLNVGYVDACKAIALEAVHYSINSTTPLPILGIPAQAG
jgi:aspartate racemase